MSAPESRLNKARTVRPAPLHAPAIFANANALLQKAIQQLPPVVRSAMVLRCDELARLQISEEALLQAFTQLLQMIVEERADGKLFLHITCAKEKEPGNEQKSRMLSRFRVQFHTNLTPHAAWMKEAERRTDNIASLLLPFGGSLLVNQLRN
jgi:hypothetical protein